MSEHIILITKDLSSDVNLAYVKRQLCKHVNYLYGIFKKEHEELRKYSVLDEQLSLFDAGAIRCVSERDFLYYQRCGMLHYKLAALRDVLYILEVAGLLSVSKHCDINKFLDVCMLELE